MLTNEYYSNLLQKLFKQWESHIDPAKKSEITKYNSEIDFATAIECIGEHSTPEEIIEMVQPLIIAMADLHREAYYNQNSKIIFILLAEITPVFLQLEKLGVPHSKLHKYAENFKNSWTPRNSEFFYKVEDYYYPLENFIKSLNEKDKHSDVHIQVSTLAPQNNFLQLENFRKGYEELYQSLELYEDRDNLLLNNADKIFNQYQISGNILFKLMIELAQKSTQALINYLNSYCVVNEKYFPSLKVFFNQTPIFSANESQILLLLNYLDNYEKNNSEIIEPLFFPEFKKIFIASYSWTKTRIESDEHSYFGLRDVGIEYCNEALQLKFNLGLSYYENSLSLNTEAIFTNQQFAAMEERLENSEAGSAGSHRSNSEGVIHPSFNAESENAPVSFAKFIAVMAEFFHLSDDLAKDIERETANYLSMLRTTFAKLNHGVIEGDQAIIKYIQRELIDGEYKNRTSSAVKKWLEKLQGEKKFADYIAWALILPEKCKHDFRNVPRDALKMLENLRANGGDEVNATLLAPTNFYRLANRVAKESMNDKDQQIADAYLKEISGIYFVHNDPIGYRSETLMLQYATDLRQATAEIQRLTAALATATPAIAAAASSQRSPSPLLRFSINRAPANVVDNNQNEQLELKRQFSG